MNTDKTKDDIFHQFASVYGEEVYQEWLMNEADFKRFLSSQNNTLLPTEKIYRWVKASERLPVTVDKYLNLRVDDRPLSGAYKSGGYFITPYARYTIEETEWLEEISIPSAAVGKMYTEETLRDAMLFASSHLSSKEGIDKYIDFIYK